MVHFDEIAMTYNFDIAMSATLSAQVVNEIVTQAVENHTGKKVTKIIVNYDGTKFDGYQVFFNPEIVKPKSSFKSTKEFIEETFTSEAK